MPRKNTINPKEITGSKKPQLHLIPPVATIEIAKVFLSGADKYGSYNWRDAGITMSTYMSAIQRHLLAFQDGETLDPDSGLNHLAHVAASAMLVLDAMSLDNVKDDRVPGKFSDYLKTP